MLKKLMITDMQEVILFAYLHEVKPKVEELLGLFDNVIEEINIPLKEDDKTTTTARRMKAYTNLFGSSPNPPSLKQIEPLMNKKISTEEKIKEDMEEIKKELTILTSYMNEEQREHYYETLDLKGTLLMVHGGGDEIKTLEERSTEEWENTPPAPIDVDAPEEPLSTFTIEVMVSQKQADCLRRYLKANNIIWKNI